ncbi:hypothetical protein HAX54_013355 [Datura stramonium]|uniref:Uncharacterized protein n=1 Tax=Datura stramonium TaxID=4076 RepID=A0ABS8TN05_DATST|nr:hypothetical protein [Datura stramonium]
MAAQITGQPILMAGQTSISYSNAINPNALKTPKQTYTPVGPIPIKKVNIISEEHVVKWMEKEVDQMNTIENLEYAVIDECRVLHLELRMPYVEEEKKQNNDKVETKGKVPIKVLSSEKVVGETMKWHITKKNRVFTKEKVPDTYNNSKSVTDEEATI